VKVLRIYPLHQRRLRGDLIVTYKILTGKERVDSQLFFQMAPEVYNLRGHSMKVYVPRCAKTVRKTFFSVRVCNSWNSLPQHVIEAQSTTHSRTDSTSSGHIRAHESFCCWAHQHQVSKKSKSTVFCTCRQTVVVITSRILYFLHYPLSRTLSKYYFLLFTP